MHLLSHFCSGFCIGSIFSLLGRQEGASSFTFPVLIGVGAVLPDLDGISVFFNHSVYYGSLWYSHHGALHSLLGMAPLSFLLASLITRCLNRRAAGTRSRSPWLIFIPLYAGHVLHILEDLPCPAGPWGGLMTFWPLVFRRFGGWAHIWWVNEYLMVVLLSGALGSLVLLKIMQAWPSARPKLMATLLISINLWALFLALRFVLVSKYTDPLQWEEYQKALLGGPLYAFVRSWNTCIQPIWIREVL